TAIAPALATKGLNRTQVHRVFTHDSPLADVCGSLQRAELIIADITYLNPTIMYVLGLSHGLGRSPILIARYFSDLPFNLSGLRCIQYSPRDWGFVTLRKQLIRAVRVFLTASHQP